MNNILSTLGTLLQNNQFQNLNNTNLNQTANAYSQNQDANLINKNHHYNPENLNDFSMPPSDYPDVFFTSNKISAASFSNASNKNLNGQMAHTNTNNSPILNPSILNLLKNFLPMLSNKSAKPDFSSILQNINPNFSNIFSMLSNNKKTNTNPNNETKKETLLDLSNLTKTN